MGIGTRTHDAERRRVLQDIEHDRGEAQLEADAGGSLAGPDFGLLDARRAFGAGRNQSETVLSWHRKSFAAAKATIPAMNVAASAHRTTRSWKQTGAPSAGRK